MKYLLLIGTFLVLISCENKYLTTPSGLKVQILQKGSGTSLKDDSVILMYVRIRNISDKTIMWAKPKNPMPHFFHRKEQAGHFQEVLKELNIGDSVYFETTAQNLYEETNKTTIPKMFIPESTIKIDLKVFKQMTEKAYSEMIQEMNGD